MKNELPTHLFQQWMKNRIFLSNSLKAKGISAVFQRQDAYKEGVAAGVDQELLQEAAWQIEAEELRSKIKEFPTQLRNFFFEDQHEYIYIYISHYMWMNEWIMRSSMNASMNESCQMNLHRQFLKGFAVVCLIAQTLARWVHYPYILMVSTCSKTVEVCCFFPTSSSGSVGWKSFAKRGGRISEEYPILPLFLTQVSLERSLKLWAEKGYHGSSGKFDRSSLIHYFLI